MPDAPAANADDPTASVRRHRQVIDNLPGLSVLAFDRDLRVQIAAGEALTRDGFDGEAMIGQLLEEALPAASLAGLRSPFAAALDGQVTIFDYRSPIDGRQFQVRVHPILDAARSVVGGISTAQDSTADSARTAHIEGLTRLGNLGAGWFDQTSGWNFDLQVRQLLTVQSDPAVEAAFGRILMPAGMNHERGFLGVLTSTESATVRGYFVDPATNDIRHLLGTGNSVIDLRGQLLHAVITLTEVTSAVTRRNPPGEAKDAAAQSRSRILLIRRAATCWRPVC